MKNLTIISLTLAALSCFAETYRLKFPATVDILDGTEVVGTKRLKAGTVVSIGETEEKSAEPKTSQSSSDGSAKSASEMPYKLFLSKRPKTGAWFRCKLTLDDYYNYDFDEKKSVYQSVAIKAYKPDGQDYDNASGYVKPASPIGKRLMTLLKDGNDHLVNAKLIPVANKNDDASTIADFKTIAEDAVE